LTGTTFAPSNDGSRIWREAFMALPSISIGR